MSSVVKEAERFGGRAEDQFNRTSDTIEQKTGIPVKEITGIAAALSSGGLAGGASMASNATNLSKIQQAAAAYGYSEKDEIEQFIKDPLGAIEDAEKAAARIAELQKTSAGRAILQQEEQLERIEGITQPVRDVATETALPTLSSLALGGDVDYQPSELLTKQLETGREGVLRNRAAGSGVKSSTTFENLSDLAQGLVSDDIQRFEQGNINLLNTGLRAEDVVRQTGTSTAGNVSNIFGNLGSQLNQAQQNIAGSQIATGQTVDSGLSSLLTLGLLA